LRGYASFAGSIWKECPVQDFPKFPKPVSGSVQHERLTEKHVGQFFWTRHKQDLVKVKLVDLSAEDGWFMLPGGVQYVKCSQVKNLAAPDGPFLTEFTPQDVGQTFWVYQGSERAQFQLLGIVAERGIFRTSQGSRVSIRWTSVTLAADGDGYSSDDDMVEGDGDRDLEWEKEAEEMEKAGSAFMGNQDSFQPVILAATKFALQKLQAAIEGLTKASDDPDRPMLDDLKQLYTYMQRISGDLQEGEGPFLCFPNEDGPIPEEVAAASGHFIQLYKPFFAADMNSQKQADFLIHESVHSCLKVTDYAYKWQHIFRFLPIEIRRKNPDSYVAVARRFFSEAIETPHGSNEVYDYTVGMIQHICYRGSQLIKRAQQGDPDVLRVLQQINPEYKDEQFKALYTLGTSKQLVTVVSSISKGTFHLEYPRPIPAKLSEASVVVQEDGTIRVSYIKPEKSRPYMVILMKVLEGTNVYGKWNIPVVKNLDEVTIRCLMPALDGPILQ
jgi:hypothetical protein